MGSKQVAVREVKTFVSDDGRHLRVYQKSASIDAIEGFDNDIDADKECLYAGVATLEDPTSGESVNVPFPIEATSVADAYAKYETERAKAVAAIEQQVQERLRVMQEAMHKPKIATAPAEALKAIDNARRIIGGQ